jgi:glycosyltransferase involved in cell wall biosynthesis
MSALAGVRVLHLFANYKWTGPADPAIRSAARLRRLGLDVTFAQAGFVHRGGEHTMAQQLAEWRLPVVTGLQLRKHFHVRSLLRDKNALRTLIGRDDYRILHCHQPYDHLLAALACRRLVRPPRIVRTLYEPKLPPIGWRERFAYGRTAAILAPTREACDGVRGGLVRDGCRVVHLDPVTERRQLVGPDRRQEWGLSAQDLVVGITARIQPHRRFDLLWNVVKAVVRQLPAARFVLLGRGDERDMERLVREPLRRHGLADRVVLPGYQRGADYEAALRTFDLFLFLVPGSDGTCRAVADAMAFGLPVVATDRGILPALLAARRAGVAPGRVCPERAAALAGAIVDLLGNAAQRRRCGEAALAITRAEMDPERAARITCGLYESIL